MKAVAKQTTYISAYPLKVLQQAASHSTETNQSPYLKALISGNARSATTRIRVSPMVNPYKVQVKPLAVRPAPKDDKSSGNNEWFNHYE